jgi:hypothetical protein
MPRTAVSAPRVTTKAELMIVVRRDRRTTINSPLTSPTSAPIPTPTPALSTPQLLVSAVIVEESARVEPTERSTPPARTTKVWPMLTMPLIATSLVTVIRLRSCAK